MDIKYAPGYKKENTLYRVIHHTGGLGTNTLASTAYLVPNDIEIAHKTRFGMLSTLESWIGYNFFICRLGVVFQARAIGEETAAQRGFNYNGVAISICLAGNFKSGVDKPTIAQINALKGLLLLLPKGKIVPHRFLQQTECFGDLPDNYFEAAVIEPSIEELKLRISLLQKLLMLIQEMKARGYKFGAQKKECNEIDVKG